MTGQLAENVEDALQRTLERYAEKAPAPAADLVGQVETRYRRRRRARTTGAVTAMALVLGGAVFGLGQDDGGTTVLQRPGTAAPPPASSEEGAESPFEITPVERLWPEAVHRIPARLPNGTEISPQALIDGRTVLVNAWGGFEKASALYAYDLGTRKATKITDVVTPPGTEIFASGFAVGDGRVVWYTRSGRTGTIWSAPLGGGKAVKAVEQVPSKIHDGTLAVSGGRIRWSASPGGVYTAPLSGGPAEPVPGTRKGRLVQWPWATGPAGAPQGGDRARITGRELRNLETGKKRVSTFTVGDANWTCWITWCSASGSHSVVERDGTGAVRLPGHLVEGTVVLDRFALSTVDSGRQTLLLVNDLRTRRSGSVTLVPEEDGSVSHFGLKGTDARMYTTRVKDEHVIVDLEAIG